MSLPLRTFAAGFLAGSSAFAGYLLAKKESPSSTSSPLVTPISMEDSAAVVDERSAPAEASSVGPHLVRMLQQHHDALMAQRAQDKDEDYTRTKWDYNWDNRQPDKLVKPIRETDLSMSSLESRQALIKNARSRVTRRVVLIRHGQYENIGGDDGDGKDSGRRLTPLGKEQAALTGKRLKELLKKLEETLVDSKGNRKQVELSLVRSTMTRATETANIILSELGVEDIAVKDCDLIREGAPIPPEPPMPKGVWDIEPKTFYEEGSRIEAGFRRYVQRAEANAVAEKVDVLVCHGNVIRYFVCRALQLPPDAWLRFSLPNASITMLYVRPSGRVGITTMGESGHLPPDKVTFS